MCSNITAVTSFLDLVRCSVERGNIGVVVLGVVKLHDLAANSRLELAIAV